MALAEAVLKEIPDQVVGYMESNNIKTNKVMVDIGIFFKRLTQIKKQVPLTNFFKDAELKKIEPEVGKFSVDLATKLNQQNKNLI